MLPKQSRNPIYHVEDSFNFRQTNTVTPNKKNGLPMISMKPKITISIDRINHIFFLEKNQPAISVRLQVFPKITGINPTASFS
jgi:hypothetical protein